MVIFEHPLNEKSRSYLRLEYLFNQLASSRKLASQDASTSFFKALLDLQELMERCDVRGDLSKDLEKQLESVKQWAVVPGVDQSVVKHIELQLDDFIYQLPRLSKVNSVIKEDRFLSSVRQRFSIPGGCCSFDLPQLHFWLSQPEEYRHSDIKRWLYHFQPLIGAIRLFLQLIREQAQFQSRIAKAGFYQDIADNADLIRIKLATEVGFYPTVSGHKNRYAVRLLPHQDGREALDICFDLAVC